MINAELNFLRVIDDELFNRIIAFGPGDGINRVSVTVQDSTSIANYGLRERVETFNDATDKGSLTTLASTYLDEHKEPVTEISVTLHTADSGASLESIFFGGEVVTYGGEDLVFWAYSEGQEVRRGDTIRVVSQDLGLNTTGVIEELDWEPTSVTLVINKKRYNLIDVLLGPEREDEREESSLGLPVPLSFRAQRSSPGIRVSMNPYTNSRATGVEVYASTVPSFTPSREYLLVKGTATEYLFPDLASGSVFYFRARSYDNQGNYSDFTDQVAAISGYVDGGRIEEGSILNLTPFASALKPPKLVLSLPTVLPDDPDWQIDDLVALGGIIYRLNDQTGNTSNDWVELSDLSLLDGRLVANRLVSAQIEAGAIKAEQIAAEAVTAGKILVNGPVTVANQDTGQDGAFVVLDGSAQEVMRLGAGIGTKPGVPSGTDYGLWGALGTGVFIEGASKFVTFGTETIVFNVSGQSVAAGALLSFATQDIADLVASPFTIPDGKKWFVQVASYEHQFSMNSFGYPVPLGGVDAVVRVGGVAAPEFLAAGTYAGPLFLRVSMSVINTSPVTLTDASGTASFSYTIFQVDA